MPQATKELSDLWDEEKAWDQLINNFTDVAGYIKPKNNYIPTEKDYSAIYYLLQEWDYGYSER